MTIRAGGQWLLRGVLTLAIAHAALLTSGGAYAGPTALDESASHRRPVKVVAPERLKVKTALGETLVAAYVSADMSKPLPSVKRVVVMVHGRLRDADKYFELTMRAAKAGAVGAETLIIAPQFLNNADAARHDVAANVARWKTDAWPGGEAGRAPFAISSFEALDGIIAQLSDRTRFPNLERIVIAAHSSGAQFVQRYAVVGRADKVLTDAGLHPYADGVSVPAGAASVMRIRYVVANPSSYVYFDATRPHAASNCRDVNHWRYGFVDTVPYVQGDVKQMQARYLTRRVIYLLGDKDTDPNHSALDKSCMAEAQGVHRLERGNNYFAHMQKVAAAQSVSLRHTRVEIPGAAHNADRMFNSACGISALFDAPGCDLKLPDAPPAAAVTPGAPSLPAAAVSANAQKAR